MSAFENPRKNKKNGPVRDIPKLKEGGGPRTADEGERARALSMESLSPMLSKIYLILFVVVGPGHQCLPPPRIATSS